MSEITKKIREEITNFTTQSVSLGSNDTFSQYKMVNTIHLFRNRKYRDGKINSQGKYRYWYDIIQPKVNDEVKNVDFDTSNVFFHSDARSDSVPVFILNAGFKQWMRDSREGEKINEAEEEGSALGNVVWKKTAKGYEKVDLKNFYVINPLAECLDDTPVIERHNMTQSDLRGMKGVWDDAMIDAVIKNCGNKVFGAKIDDYNPQNTKTPYYEVFERNGEVSTKELQEAQGKIGDANTGDNDTYVLAKIVSSGLGFKIGKEYILFAEEIDEMPYVEYHRGPYKGRWWREGLVELLYDVQTRINRIGNELASGLEYASKILFRHTDVKTVQNALTDLMNGAMINSKDLQQVEVRMNGFDQLVDEWNRLLDLANRIANSFEITSGEALPSGTPLGLGRLYNQNANKFYNFIQEKFGLAYSRIIEDWILPQMVKEIKGKDVVTIMGDEKYLTEYYQMAVDAWYVQNLIAIGPHTEQQAKMLKDIKLQELMSSKAKAQIQIEDGAFTGVLKRIQVIITGENWNVGEVDTLATLVKFESDPVRRSALLEIIGERSVRGVDFKNLPKSAPIQPMQQPQQTMQPNQAVMPQVQPALAQ